MGIASLHPSHRPKTVAPLIAFPAKLRNNIKGIRGLGAMRIILVLAAAAMCSGCATVLRGTTDQVGFNSTPSGAEEQLQTNHRRLRTAISQLIVTLPLTYVTISVTFCSESRSVRDAIARVLSIVRSECGARGRNDTLRFRAASGIIWPALRPVRGVRHWTGTGGGG
jgi:uncharacterized protein YceK